jgi:hypothetical protein
MGDGVADGGPRSWQSPFGRVRIARCAKVAAFPGRGMLSSGTVRTRSLCSPESRRG